MHRCTMLLYVCLMHMLLWVCRVILLFTARPPPASVQILWALQRCFNNSLQGQIFAPSQHSLSPCCKQTRGPEKQKEPLLPRTTFHVIPVSGVTTLGLGAQLEMDAALILCGLSLPLTQWYPNPCFFSTKSPVFLCLLPSSCPLLFIAPCCCHVVSLYYIYAVCFPFLYLCYPLQTPHPTITPCYDCTDAFIEDCVL